MKYVVFYLNEEIFEEIEEWICKLYFVWNVECFYWLDIEMNFVDKIGNKMVLKEEGFEIEELNIEIWLVEYF